MPRKVYLLSPNEQDRLRSKIRAAAYITHLDKFIHGQIDMQPHQVTAAIALLRKCLPDLNSIDMTVEGSAPVTISANPLTDEQWEQQYGEPGTKEQADNYLKAITIEGKTVQ